ncbi:MAG: hypothetical protein AAF702_42835 [Chloroflexota bacterium]
MTVSKIAEYAEVNPMTVRRWIKRGWVEAEQHPYTRRWEVDKDSVDRLLNEGPPERRETQPT